MQGVHRENETPLGLDLISIKSSINFFYLIRKSLDSNFMRKH